jgi:hypothetical protein
LLLILQLSVGRRRTRFQVLLAVGSRLVTVLITFGDEDDIPVETRKLGDAVASPLLERSRGLHLVIIIITTLQLGGSSSSDGDGANIVTVNIKIRQQSIQHHDEHTKNTMGDVGAKHSRKCS